MATENNNGLVYFQEEHKKWVKDMALLSINMFDNEHFKNIVAMGEKGVPYIMNIIKEKSDPIVHALDLIYPNAIEYKGFVTLETARKLWLSIIKIRE